MVNKRRSLSLFFSLFRYRDLSYDRFSFALTYPQIVEGDGVVGIENQDLGCERRCLAQLRRQQQTGGAEQLQLRLPDRADREEPVDVVHRQWKDLILALLLLAYLQQATGHMHYCVTHQRNHARRVITRRREIVSRSDDRGRVVAITSEYAARDANLARPARCESTLH